MVQVKGFILWLLIPIFLTIGCTSSNIEPEELFKKRCSRCHTLDRVYGVKKDREEWLTTVKRMVIYASGVIPEKEINPLTDYLVKTQVLKK